jgi:hypothetical protein
LRRSLSLAALVAFLLASAAEAHFGTGKLGYRSTVKAVKPSIDGIQFKILNGDDQLLLDNRSGKTIVIEGYSGEPYIRFSPDGIYVNVNSPAGYLNQDRYGKSEVPKSATPEAKPRWEKLAGSKIWAWHDHRIHYMSPDLPPKIRKEPRKPHHVFSWKVSGRADGKPFAITGSLDYRPPPEPSSDGFPVGLVIVLATLIGAGMVGLFALRRVLLRSLE